MRTHNIEKVLTLWNSKWIFNRKEKKWNEYWEHLLQIVCVIAIEYKQLFERGAKKKQELFV